MACSCTQNTGSALGSYVCIEDYSKVFKMKSFEKFNILYVFQGEKPHWMACALYVACRQSEVPTTDKKSTIEGNGVSLTSLLRKTKLRFVLLLLF